MRNRSVVEIMVVALTFLVAISIMALGVLLFVIVVRDPAADVDGLTQMLTTIIGTILGSLLGLLAGRTAAVTELSQRPDGTMDDVGRHTTEEP